MALMGFSLSLVYFLVVGCRVRGDMSEPVSIPAAPLPLWLNTHSKDVVVSQNKGTPIYAPIYYSPYCRDPQNGTPNFEKPPLEILRAEKSAHL